MQKEKPDEHISNEVGSSEPTGNASTIKIKALLYPLLLILVTAVAVFIYTGKEPSENSRPVSSGDSMNIKFLHNIYEGKNKFTRPIAVTVDKSGKIYVSNNNLHTIEVILPNGKGDQAFGGVGELPGQLRYPYGIGILPNSNLLITETGNYRIQEFTAKGRYVRTFLDQSNKVGLEKPGPIYVDRKGQVYVGDLSGQKVFIFDQTGKVVRVIRNLTYPHGMAVDEEGRKLFVSDTGQAVVKVFSLDRNDDRPIKVIKTGNTDKQITTVRGLAVDKKGRLYLVDTLHSTIHVFDQKGEYLFSFGRYGVGDGEFIYPHGIFIDSAGKVYIADWANNRIQIWGY